MEDRQLIHEFVTENSERAFHELVDRHVNLVHSVASRQVHDTQLAQEVTQAVFILLARKAAGLPKDVVLAGWLYRTTRFVAARALRAEQRRQRREQEAFQMQQISSSDDTWKRLAPLLDEAVEHLGRVDRDAVILRFFQEESFHQVGARMGISEEAARKRTNRSLEKLRAFFARRGVVMTSTALTAALVLHNAQAAPAMLGKKIAATSFVQVAAGTMALPALVTETLNCWIWMKTKLTIGLSAAGLVAGLLLVNGLAKSKPDPAASSTKNNDPPSAALAVNSNALATPISATNAAHVAFQCVDARSGKGVAGARIFAVSAKDQDHISTVTNLTTDAEGRCDVPLPYPSAVFVAIGALADGYEQRCAVLGHPEPVPASYVLKLPAGSKIGGVVQNENGGPVAGADIYVQFFGTGDSSDREFQRERPGFPADDLPVAKTDASGRWEFASAPETNGDFSIGVKHPDHPVASFMNDGAELGAIEPDRLLKLADLHAGSAVLMLKLGLGVHGTVTDEQHNPIPGATVSYGQFAESTNPKTETGADGTFALNHLAAGTGYVTVTAKDFAPERISVEVGANTSSLVIPLKPGGLLRLQVVDETGGGVAHARVQLQAWRGNNTLDWGGFADYQGHIQWDSAPRDEMDLCVQKEGFFMSRKNLLVADGAEHIITLHRQLSISGLVTDSDTKQPVASFKVVPSMGRQNWDRSGLAHGTNGQYQLALTEAGTPLLVRFEADGYEPAISEPLDPKASNLVYNVQLKKEDPRNAVRGVVLLPDGSVAAGAQVALCTSEKGVTLGKTKFLNRGDSIVVDADDEGRFVFPPALAPQAVFAVHMQGFGHATVDGANPVVSIQLEPWGRIEGVLKRKGRTVADQRMAVTYSSVSLAGRPMAMSLDYSSFTAETDEQGNFVFEQVPPGDLTLFLVSGPGVPWGLQTPIQLQPGATFSMQVGGTGRTVKGQFVLSDAGQSVNWQKQMRFATIATKPPPLPMPKGLQGQDAAKWRHEFMQSDAGRARAKALQAGRSFPLTVQADGSFMAEDVLPGEYQLQGQLFDAAFDPGRPNFASATRLGMVQKEIVVPETDANQSADALDIGKIPVTIFKAR